MIMRNTFREALNAGKPTIGTHFLFNDPDIAELIGDTGLFDYAEFAEKNRDEVEASLFKIQKNI